LLAVLGTAIYPIAILQKLNCNSDNTNRGFSQPPSAEYQALLQASSTCRLKDEIPQARQAHEFVQLLYDRDIRHTSDGHPVTVSSGAIATFQGWVRSTSRFLAYFSGVGFFLCRDSRVVLKMLPLKRRLHGTIVSERKFV